MKQVLLVFILLAASLLFQQSLRAQCSNRYLDSVFVSADTLFNVVYTDSAGGTAGDTLLMDVYQPAGDTVANRRVIVWAHGGSFATGTKNDGDMQVLAASFARKGYVCASINYRLAPNIVLLADSSIAFSYVMEAVGDMKAAIRFFRKDAATTNVYHIDSNMIFAAGNSAGAITADFLATIDSVNETASYFQPAITQNGGIEGNSGNSGYSSKIKAVASLAGGVNSLSWISPGDPPMICCQGTADPIVPYDCAGVFSGIIPFVTLFNICGSGAMQPQLRAEGIPNVLVPFEGQLHVPWDDNPAIMFTVDSSVAAFFDSIGGCDLAAGIKTANAGQGIKVYPIPASNYLHVSMPDNSFACEVSIYDYTGQCVWTKKESNSSFDITTANMAHGLYLMRAVNNSGATTVTRIILQ